MGTMLVRNSDRISSGQTKSSKLIVLVISLVYAIVLATLPSTQVDWMNYLNYANNSAEIFRRNMEEGIIKSLVNEPLWLLINVFLRYFLPPDRVVQFIAFFSAFLFAYKFLQTNYQKLFWLVLFLFMPQVFKNFILHVRQGLAISLFLCGYLSTNKRIRDICLIAAPFVHASFFFIWVLILLEKMARRVHFAIDLRLLYSSICSIVLGLGGLRIAALLGARQGYEYPTIGSQMETGLGFIFWFYILMLMILQGKSYIEKHSISISGIMLYLGMYFFSPIAARVFESILPLVFLSLLKLNDWRKFYAFSGFLVYFVSQWVFRIVG